MRIGKNKTLARLGILLAAVVFGGLLVQADPPETPHDFELPPGLSALRITDIQPAEGDLKGSQYRAYADQPGGALDPSQPSPTAVQLTLSLIAFPSPLV